MFQYPDNLFKERYHIPLYLEDAISLVLETRDDRPLDAIHKYFNSVLQARFGSVSTILHATAVLT